MDYLSMAESYRYQLLDRLRSDVEYYLSSDRGGKLWGLSPKEHIKTMKEIFNSLSVKPEWLTYAEILEYESALEGRYEPSEKKQVFIVEREFDDEPEKHISYMSSYELADYIDMSDCHGEIYEIFLVAEDGNHHCTYKGWQPNCLIEVIDDVTKEMVVSCIGTDH